jgi:hypothetical protein
MQWNGDQKLSEVFHEMPACWRNFLTPTRHHVCFCFFLGQFLVHRSIGWVHLTHLTYGT